MRAVYENLPADDRGGLQIKLQRLRQLVDGARRDPRFRALALQVVRGVREKDTIGEIAAVSEFTRRMRYTRDPYGVELFTDPRILAGQLAGGQLAAGDCDDHATLTAALCETLGHPTRFAVGGSRNGNRTNWQHIWTEVEARGRWMPIDDTQKGKPAGWNPAPVFDALARSPASGYRAGTMAPGYSFSTGVPIGFGELGKFRLRKVVKTIAKVATKSFTGPLQVARIAQGAGPLAKVLPTPLRKVLQKVGQVTMPIANGIVSVGSNVIPVAGPLLVQAAQQAIPNMMQSAPISSSGADNSQMPPPLPATLPRFVDPPPASYGPPEAAEDGGSNTGLLIGLAVVGLAAVVLLRKR